MHFTCRDEAELAWNSVVLSKALSTCSRGCHNQQPNIWLMSADTGTNMLPALLRGHMQSLVRIGSAGSRGQTRGRASARRSH